MTSFETWYVLAGAYAGKPKSFLTHVVANGRAVLCRRVKLESLGRDPGSAREPATCQPCLARQLSILEGEREDYRLGMETNFKAFAKTLHDLEKALDKP